MSAAMIQFVFRPNPGSSLPAIFELAKEAAALWRKHGAEVSLWIVQVGEIGNMAFSVRSESTAKLGATIDALNADPVFLEWRMKNLRSGLATWVRSNQAFEVPL
jgi:hypothetical protein